MSPATVGQAAVPGRAARRRLCWISLSRRLERTSVGRETLTNRGYDSLFKLYGQSVDEDTRKSLSEDYFRREVTLSNPKKRLLSQRFVPVSSYERAQTIVVGRSNRPRVRRSKSSAGGMPRMEYES